MVNLELIYGSDQGRDAIKKLDRNIKAVNLAANDNQDKLKVLSESKANKADTVRINASNTHLYTTALEWGLANKNTVSTYTGNGWTDLPYGTTSGHWGEVWSITGISTTVYFKHNGDTRIFYRVINDGAWWGEWQQIVTNDRGYIRPVFVNKASYLPTGLYSKWAPSDDAPMANEFNFMRIEGQDLDYNSTIGVQPATNNMYFRGADGHPWKKVATTDKIDTLFDGSTSTTFNLAKSLEGYDEFKVMGFTISDSHSQVTYNNFLFGKLGNRESGYLNFGAGVVQFIATGTLFEIINNPNKVYIKKVIGIKRGDI